MALLGTSPPEAERERGPRFETMRVETEKHHVSRVWNAD